MSPHLLPVQPSATVQDCQDWANDLKSEWGAGDGYDNYDGGVDHEEELYFQRFPLQAPHGVPAVKSGSAPADADAAVDSLTPYDVQIYTRPARAKKKYKRQADLLTRFAHALLFDWRRRVDVLALIAFDMVVRRVGVARVLYDDTLWQPRPHPTLLPIAGGALALAPSVLDHQEGDDDEDDHLAAAVQWDIRYRHRNPIILQRRNPRHTRWRRTDQGDIIAVTETYRLTIAEAERTYTEATMASRLRQVVLGRKKYERVEIQDIWVGGDRCILVEDVPIFGDSGVQPHGYPEIPYVIMPFRETSFEAPGHRYRGMLTNAGGLYEAESQVLSMHLAQLAWNAWRTWAGWLGEEREDVVIEPGSFISIDRRKGHYIEMLVGEPVPPELAQTAGMLDAYIQRNSVAGGPRGGSEGTRSAQQVWAIQSQRQLKLEQGKGALRQGVANMLRLATMIVEYCVEEPLTLPLPGRDREGEAQGEMTIKAADIQGYHDGYEVQFGRRLDPALLEQAKALQIFATNNWMPLHESWRMSGLTDNPQDWEDMLLRQNIDRLPWIIELAAVAMAKVYFGQDSPEYMRLIEKIEEQGSGASEPQPGAPGMPSPGGLQAPSGNARGGQGEGIASLGMGKKEPGGRPVGGTTPPGMAAGTPPGMTRGGSGY